jgi:zinc/manganese transport system substrate-binding protein
MNSPRLVRCAAVLVGGLLLTGCGAAGASDPTAGNGASAVAVVTSTDVWGSVVKSIGGDRVAVTSLITDPNADPHSYEASGQNQLAVSKAALVVENGGGYDDFVAKMVKSSNSGATVLDAVAISGYVPENGELNEHVWYDLPTVSKVVAQVRSALSTASPADAALFEANAKAFDRRLTALEQKEAAIKAKSAGVGVAITEPVPLYLLEASGLVNRTPPAFSEAIENENDAPAAVVAQNLALFTGHQVKALVYNEQTTGPQTEQVLAAAKSNAVAVVPVTETLPAGTDYLSWMTANVDAVAAAVG